MAPKTQRRHTLDKAYGVLSYGGARPGTLSVNAVINATYMRPETNMTNGSPVVTYPSVIIVQAGCQQVLQLPVYDPDGDLVRCRWAKQSEAESVVGPTPNTTLFENNCTLSIHFSQQGEYPVALQLEDYPQPPSVLNGPLSSVSLQLLVKVVNTTAECHDRPRILPLTPIVKKRYCNWVYEVVVKAAIMSSSKATSIQEIEVTGHPGIKWTSLQLVNPPSSPVYKDERSIRVSWLPGSYSGCDYGGKHRLCFQARDDQNMYSDPACMTMNVGYEIFRTTTTSTTTHSPTSPLVGTTSTPAKTTVPNTQSTTQPKATSLKTQPSGLITVSSTSPQTKVTKITPTKPKTSILSTGKRQNQIQSPLVGNTSNTDLTVNAFKMNTTTDASTRTKDPDHVQSWIIPAIASGSGLGLLGLVALVTALLCYKKKNKRKNTVEPFQPEQEAQNPKEAPKKQQKKP